MKKQLRFKKWGTATLFVLLAIASHGQQVGERFTVGDIEYEITAITAPPEVRIVRYTGTATEVDIPGTVMDNSTNTTYTVTAIGENTDTFDHSVIRPFMGNPQRRLTRVTIPNTVTIIGLGAFSNNALTEVTIPESVTHIRRWGLSGNQFTELTIPPNVEYIGPGAFFGVQSIPIVRSERNPPPEIDATAFDTPLGPTRNIDLVVPFTAIQAYENSGWKDIVRSITAGVTIVDGIKYGIVDSRNEATVIYGSHLNPRILAEVDIDGAPYNVTAIGDNAFGTRDIQTIVLPETVRSIGDRAFYSPVIFRVTVMADEPPELHPNAFQFPNRSERIDVFVPADKAQDYIDAGWTGFKSVSSLVGQIHNSQGLIWEVTSVNPNEVKLIKFIGLSGESLEDMFGTEGHVEIPSEIEYLPNSQNNTTYTVTAIGDGVFDAGGHNGINYWNFYHDRLTSVDIPDTVTEIGDCAFCGHELASNELASVVIPGNVESIGNRAFENTNLTNVEIPDSVTSIGESAFAQNQLTEVAIPGSVESIGNSAFENNNLTTVEIPDGVTSIGNNAFRDNNLTEVALSGSVTDIGLYAFADNPDLRLVTLEANDPPVLHELTFSNPSRDEIDLVVPMGSEQAYLDNGWDGFRSISYGIFTVDNITYGITSRTDVMVVGYTGTDTAVTIPETADNGEFPYTVAAISKGAFQNKGLTSVGIPNSVATIGERAFSDNQLTEVTLPGNLESIGFHVFYNNPDLALVTVEANTPPALHPSAFANANRHQIDLVVPAGRRQAYEDNGWGGFRSISEKIGVSIEAPAETVNLSPFTVTIQFDVEVTGFTMDDIDLVNATANQFIGSGSTYIVEIAPISCNGTVQIDVPENVTDMFNLPATATVTVEEDPGYLAANAKDITVELGANGQATILPEDVDNGSAYGCDGTPELSLDIDTFDCSDVGTPVTVTLTATQGTESATATALVTVEESPLVANAKDIIVELGANGQATISPEDVDDGSVYGCDGTPELSLDIDTFDCSDVGTPVTVTLTATAGNQTSISTAVVTVESTINSLVAVAQDIAVQLNADGMAFISPGDIDNGSGSGCNSTGTISLSLDRTVFTCDDVGMASVVLTARQGSETAMATATVAVEAYLGNLEAMAKDITVQLDASGQAVITPEMVDNGSVNGCGSTPELSLDIDTFDCEDVGTPVTVTLTATQGTESATATALVTVESPLVAMAKDITVRLDADGQATISPEDVDEGSFYGCGSAPELSLDIDTFNCGDVGTPVTVTLTATQGNQTATATATVTVEAGSNCELKPIADFNKGLSPNGDGTADTLVIQGLENYKNNVVKIYDLSQRLLFSAHYGGPEDAWDGTHENGMVPVGTYVCVIDYNEPGLGHEAKMIYVNY